MRGFILLLLSCCMFLPADSLCASEVYKYKDANGKWRFTDKLLSSLSPVATGTLYPRRASGCVIFNWITANWIATNWVAPNQVPAN
jgi:hypothetical protein